MTNLKYLQGAVFILKCSLLYPIDSKMSLCRKFLYYFWGISYISSLVIISLQCVIYLLKTPFNLIEEAMIIMNTVIYLTLFINFSLLYMKSGALVELVKQMNRHFMDSCDGLSMDKAKKWSDNFAYYWTINCIISAMFPAFCSLIIGDKTLPIQTWSPYDTSKWPLFHATYLWQIFCLINLGLIYAVFDFILPCLTLLLGTQFRLLGRHFQTNMSRALLKCPSNALSDEELMLKAEFHALNDVLFKRSIKHHQILLHFCTQINDILGPFLLVKISSAIFNMLFIAFGAINAPNSAMLVGLGIYIVVITFQLLIYTYSGQILTQSADLYQTLYEIPWYLGNLQFQKMFFIVQMRCKKETYIKAGNYFTLIAPTFITFIKSVFSYMALLKELTDRHGDN